MNKIATFQTWHLIHAGKSNWERIIHYAKGGIFLLHWEWNTNTVKNLVPFLELLRHLSCSHLAGTGTHFKI